MSKEARLKNISRRLKGLEHEDLTIERKFIRPDGSVSLETSLIVHRKGMTKEEIIAYNKKNFYDKLHKD